MRLSLGVFLTGLLMSFCVVACGSGGASGPNGAELQQEVQPPAGTSSIDLPLAVKGLQDLEAFRFDFAMHLTVDEQDGSVGLPPASPLGSSLAAALLGDLTSIEANGSFVAPNRISISMVLAGEPVDFMQIGDEGWFQVGEGWLATDAGAALGLSESPVALVLDYFPRGMLHGGLATAETLGGLATTHYSYDTDSLTGPDISLGSRSKVFGNIENGMLDVWVNGDNIPVRILLSATGTDNAGQAMDMSLEMNILEINSQTLTIDPPSIAALP